MDLTDCPYISVTYWSHNESIYVTLILTDYRISGNLNDMLANY